MKSLILSSKFWDRVIPVRFDAVNLFFIILIRTTARDDKALIAHERTHTRQILRYGPVYIWRYHKDPDFRLKVEAEAMAVQAANGAPLEDLVQDLYHNYNLNIREYEARNAIVEQLPVGEKHGKAYRFYKR